MTITNQATTMKVTDEQWEKIFGKKNDVEKKDDSLIVIKNKHCKKVYIKK